VTLPPPSRHTVRFLTQHNSRLKFVFLDKNLCKNLNCFARQKTEISRIFRKVQHIAPKMPKKHFLCVIINSKRRTRFEKLHRRAFTRKRKKKRSREDKKPRAGDSTNSTRRRRFANVPLNTARARPSFALSDFWIFVGRGVCDLSKCALSNYPKIII